MHPHCSPKQMAQRKPPWRPGYTLPCQPQRSHRPCKEGGLAERERDLLARGGCSASVMRPEDPINRGRHINDVLASGPGGRGPDNGVSDVAEGPARKRQHADMYGEGGCTRPPSASPETAEALCARSSSALPALRPPQPAPASVTGHQAAAGPTPATCWTTPTWRVRIATPNCSATARDSVNDLLRRRGWPCNDVYTHLNAGQERSSQPHNCGGGIFEIHHRRTRIRSHPDCEWLPPGALLNDPSSVLNGARRLDPRTDNRRVTYPAKVQALLSLENRPVSSPNNFVTP